MRCASSKRSSMRKRMSGANFRFTRWAISLRRKRHHVNGSEPQIGAHPHFGDGDQMRIDHRIMNRPARQNLGERMAHQFARAQRALRRDAWAVAMLMVRHGKLSICPMSR